MALREKFLQLESDFQKQCNKPQKPFPKRNIRVGNQPYRQLVSWSSAAKKPMSLHKLLDFRVSKIAPVHR
jgi:hypothetical protein